MSNVLDGFQDLASASEDEFAKAETTSQPRDAKINWPGRYRVKLKSVRKKDGTQQWPDIVKDAKQRFIYNLIFSQVDDHPMSPRGASIFHTIYLSTDSPLPEKKANTLKFAKPQLVTLSGDPAFELRQLGIKGIDTYDAEGKITEHHQFTGEFMIDVEVDINNSGNPAPSVKYLEVAKPSDSTFVKPRTQSSSAPTIPTTAAAAAQPEYNPGMVSPGDATARPSTPEVEEDLPF